MLSMKHAGRRMALLIAGAFVAGACNPSRDLTAPADEANALVQSVPPSEPPGQEQKDQLTFRGEVTSVDMAQDRFQLSSGAWIRVTAQTQITRGSDAITLAQAEHYVEEEGVTLTAQGRGDILSSEPLVISADRLQFKVQN